jgi:uncharacterized protein (DUF58 family)
VRARPTRQGISLLAAGVLAIVIGRVFGILELFLIGTALLLSTLFAMAIVALRRPQIEVERWIRPSVLTAGDVGRVEVLVESVGRSTSPPFELVEPVGPSRTARMAVAPLEANTDVSAGYRIPTERRGVLTIGPLVAVRQDVLGLARTVSEVAGVEEVLVSPRAYSLDMPLLGQGILGRHLLALAQRLGPGDFHSLRDYVDGDEPRTIHWRASARSETLKVRQHSVEGLQRCVVLLDQRVPDGPHAADAFERAVTVAASVVHSADRAGLTTRFVTTDGADLRGPDVAAQTLHLLARIEMSTGPSVPMERDPSEGLGLVVSIGTDPWVTSWAALDRIADPALTPIGVFTADVRHRIPLLAVDARSEGAFLRSWAALAGSTRAAGARRDPRAPDPILSEVAP